MAPRTRQLLAMVMVAAFATGCGTAPTASPRTTSQSNQSIPESITGRATPTFPSQSTTIVEEPSRGAEGVAVFGGEIEADVPLSYGIYLHCGVDWLGEFNGMSWYIDGMVPPKWSEQVGAVDHLMVTLVLTEGPVPHIVATTADGLNVNYLPVDQRMPGCD